MEDQKLENLLNLALGATEQEREKSLNLDVGYHPIDREWELIIKYSGNLDQVRALAIQVVELQNEYAIIRINQSRIDLLSDIPEVEYIEKPKRLFFQIANGKRVSCINDPSVGTDIALSTEFANQQTSLLALLAALDAAGLTDRVDAIHLDDLSRLTMDYAGRFSVEMEYNADYDRMLQILEAGISKLESNQTGSIRLDLNPPILTLD